MLFLIQLLLVLHTARAADLPEKPTGPIHVMASGAIHVPDLQWVSGLVLPELKRHNLFVFLVDSKHIESEVGDVLSRLVQEKFQNTDPDAVVLPITYRRWFGKSDQSFPQTLANRLGRLVLIPKTIKGWAQIKEQDWQSKTDRSVWTSYEPRKSTSRRDYTPSYRAAMEELLAEYFAGQHPPSVCIQAFLNRRESEDRKP